MRTEVAAPPPEVRPTAPPPPPSAGRWLRIAGVAALVLAAIVIVTGVLNRKHETRQVQAWTNEKVAPTVRVISPTPATGGKGLTLPGNLAAFYNAQIYSRVSGYVHAWYEDIGAHVKTGQLLATIDTPELDQQLIQARADLASADANMRLAAITAKRWNVLLAQDAVSKQESDEKSGDLQVKTALVNAARANVDRLLALKSFARIVAPFDGVVTARHTDIGALVNAGAGANPSSDLFDIAKLDSLRLYVRVPQNDSARIAPGTTATFSVPEYPGRTFAAKFVSSANAVSDNSGTVLVELSVENADRALKGGDYADVKFNLTHDEGGSNLLRLPPSALLFRKTGMEAAVVGPDDRVRIKPVTVGRDLGTSMEIAGGLTTADRVIDNPPDSIQSGEVVRVAPSSPATATGKP